MLILTNVRRPVSFLMAESSFKKPIIGTGARAMRAIPVKRAQDFKFLGKGLISSGDLPQLIQGEDCAFT